MQLFSVQCLQHRQHGSSLGAGSDGVHHQIVAAFHGGRSGDFSLKFSHPCESATGQLQRLGGGQTGGDQINPVRQPIGPT